MVDFLTGEKFQTGTNLKLVTTWVSMFDNYSFFFSASLGPFFFFDHELTAKKKAALTQDNIVSLVKLNLSWLSSH